MPWPVQNTRVVYENGWILVREDAVTRPDGSDGVYGVVETGGAAFIVAVDDRGRVALVRIDRHTTGESLEVPAGGLDGDEPLAAAQRELREEAGLSAASWTHIASLNALNGVARVRHHVFLAADLSAADAADRAEEGILSLDWVDFAEALAMCGDGRITDSETVSALAVARPHIETRSRSTDAGAAVEPPAASARTAAPSAPERLPWYAKDWVRQSIAVVVAVIGAVAISQTLTLLGLTDATWAGRTLSNLHAPLLVYTLWGPTYLALTLFVFRGLRGDDLRDRLLRTRSQRSSSPATWASTIVLIALVAVGALVLGGALGDNLILSIAAVLCLVGAWVMLLTVFALEYANLWASGRGMRFPASEREGEPADEPAMRDFIYAAMQINTTFGPGDLQFTTGAARATVTAQSVVAFLFNTVIIALLIALVV